MEGDELVDDGPVSALVGRDVSSTGVRSPRLVDAGILSEELAGAID